MKTVFEEIFNSLFIAVKRMKRMKHVRICDLWITVPYYKNSEIAPTEKNTKIKWVNLMPINSGKKLER